MDDQLALIDQFERDINDMFARINRELGTGWECSGIEIGGGVSISICPINSESTLRFRTAHFETFAEALEAAKSYSTLAKR